MICVHLWVPHCLAHKAICFCSYLQLITLTERAHSSSDEVWWWRLMMSAASHHHLASSTLFYYCLLLLRLPLITPRTPSLWSKGNVNLPESTFTTSSWYNEWKRKAFAIVDMQINLLLYSWLSLFTFMRHAISWTHSVCVCVCVWAYDFAKLVRMHVVLAVLEVRMPYLRWFYISSCCLWRKTVCVLIAHFLSPLLLAAVSS